MSADRYEEPTCHFRWWQYRDSRGGMQRELQQKWIAQDGEPMRIDFKDRGVNQHLMEFPRWSSNQIRGPMIATKEEWRAVPVVVT